MSPLFHRRALSPLSVARSRIAAARAPWSDKLVALAGGNMRPAGEPAEGECEERCWSSSAVEILDVESGALTVLPPLQEARESAFCAFHEGQLWVACGDSDYG